MSLQSNALITLDDLKGFLTIATLETKYDAELEDTINAVSDLFDCATQRNLKAGDRTEYRDGDDTSDLYLNDWPLNEGTSSVFVYIDFDHEYGSDTLIATADRRVYSLTGKVSLLSGIFPCFPQAAKVTYNAGYSTVPGDLRIAMKESCAFFRKRGKTGGIGVSAISSGQGGSVTYMETDLPKTVQAILKRYRRR